VRYKRRSRRRGSGARIEAWKYESRGDATTAIRVLDVLLYGTVQGPPNHRSRLFVGHVSQLAVLSWWMEVVHVELPCWLADGRRMYVAMQVMAAGVRLRLSDS